MSGLTCAEMQCRLDAVLIDLNVENGDVTFDVTFEGFYDEHHWSITLSHFEEGDQDDTPSTECYSLAFTRFSGVTFADAVEALWLHHGSPFLCPDCDDGDGPEVVGVVPGNASRRVADDGRVTYHHACETCAGDRIIKPATVES